MEFLNIRTESQNKSQNIIKLIFCYITMLNIQNILKLFKISSNIQLFIFTTHHHLRMKSFDVKIIIQESILQLKMAFRFA